MALTNKKSPKNLKIASRIVSQANLRYQLASHPHNAMAGHATSSVLDIVPESEAATVGSSGPSFQSFTPEVNSQTAVQYLNAYNSPADIRATQNSGILESLTPANAAAITARSVHPTSRTVRWNWVNYLRSRWQHISSSSKVLLIITTAISIIQVRKKKRVISMLGDVR
jgi:hypothetical protein